MSLSIYSCTNPTTSRSSYPGCHNFLSHKNCRTDIFYQYGSPVASTTFSHNRFPVNINHLCNISVLDHPLMYQIQRRLTHDRYINMIS